LEFTVALDTPFSLEHTLRSGQVFRWEKRGDWWCGLVAGASLKAMQEGDVLRCESSSDRVDSIFVSEYFRLKDDLDQILAHLSKGKLLVRAVERFYGLRLIRQDPWECLASFVLATNANIPRIMKMVSAICERFGTPFVVDRETLRAFPTPQRLASASVAELRGCGLGYRAPFLKRVAMSVADGKVDFVLVSSLKYDDARKELLKELFGEKVLLGVGPKVADCVLLYSCGKDEAFPIDVWISRTLAGFYPRLLLPSLRSRFASSKAQKLSPADYARISSSARRYFGKHAGYAQQYLYMAAKEEDLL
jgi:N-glycosylase/DNA lyase